MSLSFDPRGDLPPSHIQLSSYVSRPTQSAHDYNRHSAYIVTSHKARQQRRRTCYDWVFSTASNAHIAIDRASFITYTAYKSHVLSLADQHQVKVIGVGTVVLSIRRQAGSKESHNIILKNVLHVPGWMCNVFSDVYFTPATAFEHNWTDIGVSFMKRTDEGSFRNWGFTEDFCGLERLVLAKEYRGTSPILEDKDREVFSVNLTWPQGQRDKWEEFVRKEYKVQVARAKLRQLDPNAIPPRRSVHVERKSIG